MENVFRRIKNITGYAPSSYQRGVLEFLLNGAGNGACNAVAGSGKSSTLLIAAIALSATGITPDDLKVLVFGKANAEDLQGKLSKLIGRWRQCASTLHSMGFSLLKQERDRKAVKVEGQKYKQIAQDLGLLSKKDRKGSLVEEKVCSESDFLKLVDLMRLTNQVALPETVQALAQEHEVELSEFHQVAEAIADCLNLGEVLAQEEGSIDFTDMIWLPVRWHLHTRPWFRAYKYLFVDECQDLNQAQLTLALMLAGQVEGYRGKPGRILFVGDPFQAIMGFAGADSDSYSHIVNQAKATELPLSTCYRCPTSHIALVKRLFPHIPIEPQANAPAGSIRTIEETQLNQQLKTGDMVLSRKTAPLVKLCIQLITRGIRATVKGRDIGDGLKRELENIAKLPRFNFSQFGSFLNEYAKLKAEKYEGLDNCEQLIKSLADKLNALEEIYLAQVQATSVSALAAYIDDLFADNGKSPITLATAHRSKGLENQRIFLLEPDSLPLTWKGQQDWQFQQESNLLYVALTRSTAELFLVGEPEWLPAATVTEAPALADNTEIAQSIQALCQQLGVETVIRSALSLSSPEEIKAIRLLVNVA
ncbi:MAG: ATP-dependent helicase [Phormidesmis priestleyi]|uniref:DNA 3'-5' helicase n=1 Tax=Phormidesmis priestleyi TaxID=268141 RepID=A0A2W4X4P5_9CYAN|nr:MAG: ATP-dependent helicase [Phormidesmis priestleyi]